MKIQPPATFTPFERIRKSDDAGGEKRRQSPNQEKGSSKKDPEDEKFDLKTLGEAVDHFGQDAHSAGLNAEVEGHGPGLRVTLKDGSGAVVRQFTGEEFLRLRDAAQGIGRGRLLDKKL